MAVKTVLAKADQTPLLIFDEVDANIGGVVAGKIGEELKLLGNSHQVICITHQAQVAAFADCHYQIEKHQSQQRTYTEIKELQKEDRVAEMVRMLGGGKKDGVVHKHAIELLEKA